MGDEAKELGCSVSYISAIERGEREVPREFPDKFSRWLNLSEAECQELRRLVKRRPKFIEVAPADEERAVVADEFAANLNKISIEQLREIRRQLTSPKEKKKQTSEEIKNLAALARTCFELGNRLTFDLIDILENKLPEIDRKFLLQVDQDHVLGDQVAAYLKNTGNSVQKLVFSEHAYTSAAQQTPEGRTVGAHELAHWLMHSGEKLTFQRYKR